MNIARQILEFAAAARCRLPRALLFLSAVALFGALDAPGGHLAPTGPMPASAQNGFPFFGWDEPPRPRRPIPQQEGRGGGGGFFPFFNWGQPRYRVLPDEPDDRRARRPAAHGDPTRPPPPKKVETEPAHTVLVMGDGMADWLAYGLEEAFEDGAEFGAVRKGRAGSGLIQNDPKDFDWLQNARDILAKEKADLIVMMIGLADRHAIKERPPARAGQQGQPLALQPEAGQKNADGNDKPGTLATHEFRSDRWAELYAKRVDDMIGVLKSKRVPVIWVGLPPIRGPKSRADLSAINDIFRAEAQKAGIAYVDVWEGFLDESGDFSSYGPDVIGQVRRLRSSDGVFFTKAGARKLAHFVDREIKRLLSRDAPVALPVPEMPEKVPDDLSGPAQRPAAGPVVPLTGAPASAATLLGGASTAQPSGDTLAAKVLVNGEPPAAAPGRADNFAWPRAEPANENAMIEPPAEAAGAPPRPPAARGQKPPAAERPSAAPTRIGPRAQGRPAGAQASTPQGSVR